MRIGHTIKISNIDNIENTPNIKTNTLWENLTLIKDNIWGGFNIGLKVISIMMVDEIDSNFWVIV